MSWLRKEPGYQQPWTEITRSPPPPPPRTLRVKLSGSEKFWKFLTEEWSHDDVIKWKHFPHYWPFVRGIHRSPVNSPHKGQWRGALMFPLICVWINGWVNNREAGDLRRYRAHYDVIVMSIIFFEFTKSHIVTVTVQGLRTTMNNLSNFQCWLGSGVSKSWKCEISVTYWILNQEKKSVCLSLRGRIITCICAMVLPQWT